MTVKELIEKLKKCDEDSIIKVTALVKRSFVLVTSDAEVVDEYIDKNKTKIVEIY